MRRLAKQSRKDAYPSRKDYQEIQRRHLLEISFEENGSSSVITFTKEIEKLDMVAVGFGGYIKTLDARDITVRFSSPRAATSKVFTVRKGWNRIGLAIAGTKGIYKARVEVSPSTRRILLWGINIDGVNFPKSLAKITPTLEDLNSEYVCPETLYLDHASPVAVEILEEESTRLTIRDSLESVEVKKCSYDGRYLPLDSSKLGLLAFHKHNAKRTRHQNECRACKKWKKPCLENVR